MELVVCLVSGGIDSPVACALAARGFEVVPLHFSLYSYTCEENFYTAVGILRELKKKTGYKRAIVFPWARILQKILRESGKYACVMCRRGMLKAAERVCEQEGATGIVTGESLGQKASQTLQNLLVVSKGIRYPVLRPLLAMDKLDIERLSKRLDLWRESHAGCCYAIPRHPRTAAKSVEVERLESKLRLDELIEREFENTVEIRTWEEDLRSFLQATAT